MGKNIASKDKDQRGRRRWPPCDATQPFEADALAYVTRRTIKILCEEDNDKANERVSASNTTNRGMSESLYLRKDVEISDVEDYSQSHNHSAIEFQKCWDMTKQEFDWTGLQEDEHSTMIGDASSPPVRSGSKVLDEFSIPVEFSLSRLRQKASLDDGSLELDKRSPMVTTSPQQDAGKIASSTLSPNSDSNDAASKVPGQKRRKRTVGVKNTVPRKKKQRPNGANPSPRSRTCSPEKLLNKEIPDVVKLHAMAQILATLKEQQANKLSKLETKSCEELCLTPILSQNVGVNLTGKALIKNSPSASVDDNCLLRLLEITQQLESPAAPHIPNLQLTEGYTDTADALMVLQHNAESCQASRCNQTVVPDKQEELPDESPPILSSMKDATTFEPTRRDNAEVARSDSVLPGEANNQEPPLQYVEKVAHLDSEGPEVALARNDTEGRIVGVEKISHDLLSTTHPSRVLGTMEKGGSPASLEKDVTATETGTKTSQISHNLLEQPDRCIQDKDPGGREIECPVTVAVLPKTNAYLGKVMHRSVEENNQMENNLVSEDTDKPYSPEHQPFTHALFAKPGTQPVRTSLSVTGPPENYENVVWIPHDPSEIVLKQTEIELAWLCEESKYCLNQEDISWEFVWEYASPTLKVEMRSLQLGDGNNLPRLVRLHDPLVSRRFESKRQEISKSLRTGIRRPVMSNVVAEMRLRGRQGKLNLVPAVASAALPRDAAVAKRGKKKKYCKKASTDPKQAIESKRLSAMEEEIAWLGEESFLLDPRQEGFNIDFVREHASPMLEALIDKTISGEAHRRWLPRLVRLQDPYVKNEFESKRDEIRQQLRAGFRRPQTKDFLPLTAVPLPVQVRVRESYLSAFRKQPRTSSVKSYRG